MPFASVALRPPATLLNYWPKSSFFIKWQIFSSFLILLPKNSANKAKNLFASEHTYSIYNQQIPLNHSKAMEGERIRFFNTNKKLSSLCTFSLLIIFSDEMIDKL